jgi:hypothetical protein
MIRKAELFWPIAYFLVDLVHLDRTSQPDFCKSASPFNPLPCRKGFLAHLQLASTMQLPKSIYMVKVDVAAYGSGLQNALKSAPGGLYMTNGSAPLGKNTGLRQDYRWGVLNSCAYTKDSGICNGTTFPVEFQPLKVILSDTPMKFYVQTNDIIPDEASNFRSESFNGNLSKVAFGMMVVSHGI